jgi:hypothetical protein
MGLNHTAPVACGSIVAEYVPVTPRAAGRPRRLFSVRHTYREYHP